MIHLCCVRSYVLQWLLLPPIVVFVVFDAGVTIIVTVVAIRFLPVTLLRLSSHFPTCTDFLATAHRAYDSRISQFRSTYCSHLFMRIYSFLNYLTVC